MTQQQIHELFKQSYNRTNWKQFLGETFANARLLPTPEILTGIDSNVASEALKLGYVILNEDGIERQIAIYEVKLAQGIILERNRVGLRNVLRRYWKDIDAAFIVYHQADSSKWRFSYVSELTGYDAEGEFVKIKTEPKRYTYVLGEGESTRTASERFSIVASKSSKATLDDVKEAFSVEKLSKAFFDEYRKHYDIFCDFMVSKPYIRQTIFDGDEKSIRDFNKKLLGRIVFLYFIQKKGWLGVPINSEWGKGDFNFLTKQFEHFRNKDLFYTEFLSTLFFDTLNSKREGDLIELVKGEPCRIPFLNGGLFEEDDKKHRNLILPAELFQNLFGFFNQYNFTIYEDDPNDHTVAVDPEMLGHIFENLLEDNKDKGAFYTPKEIVHYMCQESLIEYLTTWFEKKGYEIKGYSEFGNTQPQLFPVNEGRKGQLVLEANFKPLDKHIDRLLIEKLLQKKLTNHDKKVVLEHSDEFHQALDQVKICDPAIGSGAFPMGLLHEIFTAKQTLHTFKFGNTTNFDASGVKLNIIQNSIYGVDIEKGAVDIARLRFWLSLIVDEPEPKALPNLDYKIIVGNSLLSKLQVDNDELIIDISWDKKISVGKADEFIKKNIIALKQLSQKQKEYFIIDNKCQLKAEIRNLKIDILINQLSYKKEQYIDNHTFKNDMGFGLKPDDIRNNLEITISLEGFDVAIKKLEKLKINPNAPLLFFDWKLDFPEIMNEQVTEKVGFDIVIANPPYVGQKGHKEMFQEIKDTSLGKLYHQRRMDLFYFFFHLGLINLKPSGILTFITTNYFLTATYADKLRKHIYDESTILSMANLNELKIFESAQGQHNLITMLKKGKFPDIIAKTLLTKKQGQADETIIGKILNCQDSETEYHKQSQISLFEEGTLYIRIESSKETLNMVSDCSSVLNKIKEGAERLNKYVNIEQGIVSGADKVSDKIISEYPLLNLNKGDGIFILTRKEVDSLNLSKEELSIIKPIYKNSDLQKWCFKPKRELFLIYLKDEGEPIILGQKLTNHFNRFKSILVDKKENCFKNVWLKKIVEPWLLRGNYFVLFYPRNKESFEKIKIVNSRRSYSNSFALEDKGYFEQSDIVFSTLKKAYENKIDIKYFLAILNSKLIYTWLFNKGKRKGMQLELYQKPLSEIPIRIGEKNLQLKLVNIVEKILDEKNNNNGGNISGLERQIDNLVYILYGLSYDEVKVIDSEFELTEAEYKAIKLD